MAGSQLSSEAECPLDWTWLDNAWEDLIYEDLAYEDETQYGKETEESRPGHNLQLAYMHTLPHPPALEFPLQEETPSLSTTPRDISDSNSALPFSPDQTASEPYIAYSDVVNNTDSPHNQGGRYHCLECNRPFKLEKDLRRHVETTRAHRPAVFQCCCAHTSGRKDNFLKHIKGKKTCSPTVPFMCSCGYEIDSNSPDAITLLLEHVKPCGQRKRGRPKK